MLTIRFRTLALACIACGLLGWFYSGSSEDARPLSDRPVARWIARAARAGLWVLWCAEPAPESAPQLVHAPPARGDDRHEINHGRGW
jgi:hypothetical protein